MADTNGHEKATIPAPSQTSPGSPNGISKLPKTKVGRLKALSQLVRIQDVLYDSATSGDITASALAQVARAWSELEERKRILRMKPKPKDVEVAKITRPSRAKPQLMAQEDEPARPIVAQDQGPTTTGSSPKPE